MSWLKMFLPSAFGIITKYLTLGLIILIGLISFYAYVEKTRYERTAQQIATIQHDYDIATTNRKIENTLKINLANQQLAILSKSHLDEINSVKGQYEKTNQLSNLTINDLRNQLRNKIASNPINLPKITSDTKRTSEEWRNSYTTLTQQYETLVDGCKITTSDYNLLKQYSDNNCLLFGCE